MSNFWHLQRLAATVFGWPLTLLLMATCAASAWLALGLPFKRPRRRALRFAVSTAAISAVLAGYTLSRTREALAELLAWLRTEPDPSERARYIAEAFTRVIFSVHLAAPVLAGAAFVILLALLKGGAKGSGRRLAIGGTILVAATAIAAWAANRVLAVVGSCLPDCFSALLAQSQRWASWGRWGVAGVAGLCWLWLLAGARTDAQRGQAHSRQTLVLSSLLLVLGGAAFFRTRGFDWDAQHPIPPDPPHLQACFSEEPPIAQLPPARPRCDTVDGPIFAIVPQGALIDGNVTAAPADLQRTLKAKRELWQMLNPDRPFPAVVLVAAPATTTTQALLPWLTAAHEAGFSTVGAYLRASTQRLETKTLGPLDKLRCCTAAWKLDASAGALSTWQTWGDFTASGKSEESVALR